MHRWHSIVLDTMHEINRQEVVRLLALLEATSPEALDAKERAFLDRMMELSTSRRIPAVAVPLLLLLCSASGASAQNASVFGWVRTEGSLEPVPYASVSAADGLRGVLTDERGYYVLAGLPAGPLGLRITQLGHVPVDTTVTLAAGERLRVDVQIQPAAVRLPEILVVGDREDLGVPAPGPPPIRIDAPTLDLIPALAEKDAMRTLQLLPAVAAASDFSTALYVRGGSPDQNLVLIDGAPVFNPYHLGGLFSAIDPDAISTLEMQPGGMAAPDGDRASSVVKVWTRDGGRDRVRSHGALGLVSSRLGVDGPLPGGDGSYLVSARRTYFDLISRAAYELGVIPTPFPYSFTDAHAKVTHDVGRTGRVSVSGYVNDERIHTPREVEPNSRTAWSWGTRAGSAAYRQPLGGALLAEVTVAATSFDGDFDVIEILPETAEADTLFLGRISMRDIMGNAAITWYGARHKLRLGLQVDDYAFRYTFHLGGGRSQAGDPTGDDLGGEDIFAAIRRDAGITTLAGYVESDWSLTPDLSVRAGLRTLAAEGLGATWMPRVGLRYAVGERVALTAGAGRYAQAIQSLRDEESILASVMPYELLVPADSEVGMTVAEDIVVGAEFNAADTRMRVEGYAKRYPNLPIPPLAPDPFTAPVFAAEFRRGTGSAVGLEVFGQHRRGASTVLVSYALTWANREMEGRSYVPRFHRRHMLDVTGGWGIFQGSLVTARVAAGTGQPYTPAIARLGPFRYDPSTGTYRPLPAAAGVVLGEHNSERLPGYLRMDLGYRGHVERRIFGREMTMTPYLQVLNVLGNRNVVTGAPQYDEFEGAAQVEYFPALPTLPTFGIEWSF